MTEDKDREINNIIKTAFRQEHEVIQSFLDFLTDKVRNKETIFPSEIIHKRSLLANMRYEIIADMWEKIEKAQNRKY